MGTRAKFAVELIGGPFDGETEHLEEMDAWQTFEVTRSTRRGEVTAVYELETDPDMDENHWAFYKRTVKGEW